MKKLFPLLLGASVTLVACGSVESSAPPSAAELMRAPNSLNLAGRTLSLEALPTLSGELLTVQAKVSSDTSYLPLAVREMYLITQGGVWNTVGQWQAARCGSACEMAVGSGYAGGLLSGEQVQVVVRLQDSAGRNFWLRDDHASIR